MMNIEKKQGALTEGAEKANQKFDEMTDEALQQVTGGNYTRIEYPGTAPTVNGKISWGIEKKDLPETIPGHNGGIPLDIEMKDSQGSPLATGFANPITLSVDISDWTDPDKFIPAFIKDDGTGVWNSES